MKNIKKLLLTSFVPGFILGCAITNISAMQDDAMKGLPRPDFTAMAEGAPSATATTSIAQTPAPSDIEKQAFEATYGIDFLSALPDLALQNFLAQYVEHYFTGVLDQDTFSENRKHASNCLKILRRINKKFKDLLTDQTIMIILNEAHANAIARKIAFANIINTDTGETLLHRAINCGDIPLTKALIEAGVEAINTPLAYPISPEILKRFPMGSTPLHFAVKQNYVDIVQLLLEHGADFTATTISTYTAPTNLTPLDIARREGLYQIVEILEAAYQAKGIPVPEKRPLFHVGAMKTKKGHPTAPTAMETDPILEDDDSFSLMAPAPTAPAPIAPASIAPAPLANLARILDFSDGDISSEDEDDL